MADQARETGFRQVNCAVRMSQSVGRFALLVAGRSANPMTNTSAMSRCTI